MQLDYILGVIKRNPLFFHSISCKNNEFFFTTPNIWLYMICIVIKYNQSLTISDVHICPLSFHFLIYFCLLELWWVMPKFTDILYIHTYMYKIIHMDRLATLRFKHMLGNRTNKNKSNLTQKIIFSQNWS